MVCVNTHKGLFRYTRLPFGVASAPSIFQRLMETILQGIPKVIVYIDDILVSGHSEEKHRELLRRVLNRLQKVGIRLKLSKCSFMVDSVVYLGYKVDARGIHLVSDKEKAVQEVPEPKDILQLKSYIGLLTYYARFLPNLATSLVPLYKLL